MRTTNPKKRAVMLGVAVAVGLAVALGQAAFAGSVTLPWSFTNGTTADATQVNANFQALKTALDGHDSQLAALPRPSAAFRDIEWGGWTIASTSSYSLNASTGTVIDNTTGLVWQRAVDPNSYTWAGAQDYCRALDLGGYSIGTWRLPSLVELVSIVDYGQYNPSIDTTAFPSTPVTWFWSSSPSAQATGNAWGVNFYTGGAYYFPTGSTYGVRCVR